jgi:hypothetical protein
MVKSVQWMLHHAWAAMTLDVHFGLFDDDLTALAERMDAAARSAEEALVGAESGREAVSGQTPRSATWAPRGSNPQPAD